MMPNSIQPESIAIARALHSSLDLPELKEALKRLLADGFTSAYSVLFHEPQSDLFQIYMSEPPCEAPSLDNETAVLLRRFFRANIGVVQKFNPPFKLAGDLPPAHAGVTLTFRNEAYGLLLLHGKGTYDPTHWQPIVDCLSVEMVKMQMVETANAEASASHTKLNALNEAGELVKYVELETLLTKLMEMSLRILNAQVGAIVLRGENGASRTSVEWGLQGALLNSLKTPGGESFLHTVLQRSEPLLIEDTAASDEIDARNLDVKLRSLLAVPLLTQGKKLGAIFIVNSESRGFDQHDADALATIAGLAAAAVDNALLYEQAIKHERISAEMTLASTIQQSLLPQSAPKLPGLQIDGWSIACTETGGDYFDFLDIGDGRIGIIIGDATGHGMGAALLMFIVRASLHALLTHSSDISDVTATLNNLVEKDSNDGRFMTFFFGIYDSDTRTFTYTSAGHDAPLLFRPGVQSFVPLDSTGIPLGVMGGSDYPTVCIPLLSGDCLVLGTDGIWEARDPKGDFYGKERLQDLIRLHHNGGLNKLSREIRNDVIRFRGDTEQTDDITAVLIRVE